MSQLRLISVQDSGWQDVLTRCCQYDFYHLPQYHALAQVDGSSVVRLAVYEQGDYTIALPLLLRAIDNPADAACPLANYHDATSVYGYVGPVFSHTNMPDDVIHDFQQSIRQVLAEQNIVSLFSRLHPLIDQADLVNGLGHQPVRGRTISIDLGLSPDQQWREYNKSLRNRINKLQRLGVTCIHDDKGDYITEFADIYAETMARRHAADAYKFSSTYLRNLMQALEPHCHLFLCQLDGIIICGGMYMYCKGVIQAHLGGVRTEFLKYSPTTLEIDAARLWGNEVGARLLHLGGGVGAQEDSVFDFKAAFSSTRHTFRTWQWVLNEEAYAILSQQNRAESAAAQNGYFPAYRAP